jgi:IS30 family transposase
MTTSPTADQLAAASVDAAASLAAGAIARSIDQAEQTYRRELRRLRDQHRCGADCADLHSRTPATGCDG